MGKWEWQVILHFQTTLPLLREANVAQVFFYWFSVSVSSLSRVHLEARKTIFWSYSFLCFFWERGVVVRQTRQGRAEQGKAGSL